MEKKRARIGLIGAGFMGRCHANAFRSVGGLFDLPVEPVLHMLADATEELAARNATALGFTHHTSDWAHLCSDPDIDIVAVTAPNPLHEPLVLAAINAGKTVYCEKPLSVTADSALRMTRAAETSGCLTAVGFNFLRNPMIKLARDVLVSGELGEISSFRGRHAENYMADPSAPHSFRTDILGGGAAADIGSHIISMARYLLGPIAAVNAQCTTIHSERPIRAGSSEKAPVLVDDMTQALVTFEGGFKGTIEANWAAVGRTMDLSWEIAGTKGAMAFTQERMNELLISSVNASSGREGFTRIEAGPSHPPYGNFCPAPGHHLGFNDLKIIEVAELLEAHANNGRCSPDFREAFEVQRVVEAMHASSREGGWVRLH